MANRWLFVCKFSESDFYLFNKIKTQAMVSRQSGKEFLIVKSCNNPIFSNQKGVVYETAWVSI